MYTRPSCRVCVGVGVGVGVGGGVCAAVAGLPCEGGGGEGRAHVGANVGRVELAGERAVVCSCGGRSLLTVHENELSCMWVRKNRSWYTLTQLTFRRLGATLETRIAGSGYGGTDGQCRPTSFARKWAMRIDRRAARKEKIDGEQI